MLEHNTASWRVAERIGLVSAVFPREELLDRACAFMAEVTKNGPVALRMALESVYLALDSASGELVGRKKGGGGAVLGIYDSGDQDRFVTLSENGSLTAWAVGE